MSEKLFLILYTILTIANYIVLLRTRRERKVIKEAEKEILADAKTASDVLETFYGKLNEFMIGISEIADKSKTENETSNP